MLVLLLVARLSAQTGKLLLLTSQSFALTFSRGGKVTALLFKKDGHAKPVFAYTEIEGFIRQNAKALSSKDKQSIRFEHDLYAQVCSNIVNW